MEAVTAHPLGGERPWQGEFLCERGRAAVKGSVEAGDLRHFGCDGADRADRGDVGWCSGASGTNSSIAASTLSSISAGFA